MNWKAINPVLIALFTELAVDQPVDGAEWKAEWREGQRGFVHPTIQQALYLKVTTCVGTGDDETRMGFDETANDLFESRCGMRRFTLQVQAVVLDHTDEIWAMQTLERIRTRLCWTRSLDALLAVNVSLVDILPAIKASKTIEKRVVSIGNMDVIFAAAVNDRDPVPIGWLERIVLSSRLTEGGELLPSPPNVTDETIPPV